MLGSAQKTSEKKSEPDHWVRTSCDINAASMFAWTEVVGGMRNVRLMQTYHVTLTDTAGERVNVTSACQDFDESTETCKVIACFFTATTHMGIAGGHCREPCWELR